MNRDEAPRLLSADMFAFEFDAELRRAVRSRSHLTLVVMEAHDEGEAAAADTSDTPLKEIAKVVGTRIRETDLLGQTDSDALSLVLVDADFEHSTTVINRLISRIEREPFPSAVRIVIGAACYPNHAVDAVSLKREAQSRTVASWQGGAEQAAHY